MRKNLYGAFTLVEMLIVMGILIILMAVGITAGRFAINRANNVAHQNAADQIYTSLLAYYTDNRVYPNAPTPYTPSTLVGTKTTPGPLWDYMDQGSFNGGTEATFIYIVGNQDQSTLVCVSLGGIEDENNGGYYCAGNGFNDSDFTIGTGTGGDITKKTITTEDSLAYGIIDGLSTGTGAADWAATGWN